MKKIAILAILLSLFVGMAGATIPTPTYNFGPASGFYNPGPIKSTYLSATSDASVGGDLTVTGALSATGGITSAGVFGETLRLPAPYQWVQGTGAANYAGLVRANTISSNGTIKGAGTATLNRAVSNTSLYVTTTSELIGNTKETGTFTAGTITSNGTIAGTTGVFTGMYNSGNSQIMGTAKVTGAATFASAAVNASDGLTVNSVIVPTEMAITIPEGNLTSKAIFTADAAWKVTAIREIHSVLGDAGNTYNIEKLTSGTAPGSGTNCMSSTGSISSTVNVPASPALSATPSDYTLAAGDSLGVKLSANHPGALLGVITVYLKRV
jgi:hypothetical protein